MSLRTVGHASGTREERPIPVDFVRDADRGRSGSEQAIAGNCQGRSFERPPMGVLLVLGVFAVFALMFMGPFLIVALTARDRGSPVAGSQQPVGSE